MAAKVRPALLITGTPADDELDIVTVLLHTTALRGNRWELSIPKPFLRPGAFHLQSNDYRHAAQHQSVMGHCTGAGEDFDGVLKSQDRSIVTTCATNVCF